MKRPSFPLWLLRDVPAFMGLVVSFWTLIIFMMTSGCKAASASQGVRDHFALLLAFTEARLDYALWREAYRRLGWSPRDIPLQVFPPTEHWSETRARFLSFAHAFRNMNQVVDAYVGHLRAQHGISEREAMNARGPFRLAVRSTSPMLRMEAESTARVSSSGASRRSVAKAEGGSRSSRGPPLISVSRNRPPRRPHLRGSTRLPNARNAPIHLPMTTRTTLIRLMKRATQLAPARR